MVGDGSVRDPGRVGQPGSACPDTTVLVLLGLVGLAPSIAGVLMTWRHGGWAGLRDLWKRCIRFNLGGRAYLVVFLVPALISGARIVVQLLRGRTLSLPRPLAQPALLAGLTVQLFLFGPLSEELGWRGFAMDRVLARWGAIRSHLTSNHANSLVWMSFYGRPVDRLVTGLAAVGAAAVLVWVGRLL